MKPDIELVGCTQSYGIASGGYRRVLTDISMTLCGNEVVLVRGPSGSGKSTLGRILALWEMPHHGTIRVRGHAITSLREGAVWRRGFVSYVPQHLALVPEWTAWDNCEWALQPLGLIITGNELSASTRPGDPIFNRISPHSRRFTLRRPTTTPSHGARFSL